MSRNDTYLSLCLDQASQSSLHYRHGCIIVRGGKVIGKGFNAYRSGYNGGALTTGQMKSADGVSNPAIQALKAKCKKVRGRAIAKHQRGLNGPRKPGSNNIPFEDQVAGSGGGCQANKPLSMHSEMMAIHSALSLSSVISCQGTARSTQWLQKPCFKLSSRSKRRNRLQRLKTFADQAMESITALEYASLSHIEQSRLRPDRVLHVGRLQGRLQEEAARGASAVAAGENPHHFRGVPAKAAFEETAESSG